MNKLATVGAVLALLGILGLAIPYFTTSKTEDVAKIGDLSVQATHDVGHSIPPAAAGGVLILGAVLLGLGVMRRA